MSKILVIGAGVGQVHLVRLAKTMGLYTIVVSPKGDYPAIPIADELFDCDIYDRVRIVDFAKTHGIRAVISDQNDLMMPTVAYVADSLGIPGNTFDQVMSYCDKTRFRAVCDEIGIPVPKHITFSDSTMQQLDAPLPWIVKPADSQSNIGITKITDMAQYENAILLAINKSKQRKAIVEQFFTGQEYVCEGFVYEGIYYLLSFGDRRYFDGELIPCQTIFPSCLDGEIQNKIVACEQKIANAIHPKFGIVHSEYLVNHVTGEFCVIESAIRGGGVFISSHLIPMATGVDVNSLLLKCALGLVTQDIVARVLSTRCNRAAAYVCFTLPQGVVQSIEGMDRVLEVPGVEMCDLRGLSVGMQTEPMHVKGARRGPILVWAESRYELETRIEQVKQRLSVKVLTDNGEIKNIIWE